MPKRVFQSASTKNSSTSLGVPVATIAGLIASIRLSYQMKGPVLATIVVYTEPRGASDQTAQPATDAGERWGSSGQILQFGGKPPAAAADPGVVAMIGLPAGTRLWIAAGVTHMRCDSGGWRLRTTALYRDRHIDGVCSAI